MHTSALAAAALAAAATLSAAPSFAASDRVVLDRPIPAARSAGTVTASNVDRAEVISATPVIRQVLVPQRSCVDQPVVLQRQPSGAGALLGAVAGAAVGTAVGGGSGRAAATALGLVGGAALGNQVEAGGADTVTRLERRCSTQGAYEERTVGYDVVYEYNGRQFTTRMRNDPGEFVQVQVQATGAGEPAAAYAAPSRGRIGQPLPAVGVAAAPPLLETEPVYDSYPVYPAAYYAPPYAGYYAPYYAPSYVPFGTGLALGAVIGFGSGGHYHGGWRGGRRH